MPASVTHNQLADTRHWCKIGFLHFSLGPMYAVELEVKIRSLLLRKVRSPQVSSNYTRNERIHEKKNVHVFVHCSRAGICPFGAPGPMTCTKSFRPALGLHDLLCWASRCDVKVTILQGCNAFLYGRRPQGARDCRIMWHANLM
jgi:hypothetical protein